MRTPFLLANISLALGAILLPQSSEAVFIPLSGSASFSATGGVDLLGGSDLFVPHLAGKTDFESLSASPLSFVLHSMAFGTNNTGDYIGLSGVGFSFNTNNTLVLNTPSTLIIQAGSTVGIYTPDPASVSFTSTSDFINVISSGVVTPGLLDGTQPGGCKTGGNSCADTLSRLNFSFTKTGSAVSMSGTLFSPVLVTVPEPGSLSLLGIGLAAGLRGARRASVRPA